MTEIAFWIATRFSDKVWISTAACNSTLKNRKEALRDITVCNYSNTEGTTLSKWALKLGSIKPFNTILKYQELENWKAFGFVLLLWLVHDSLEK